jgi:2-iminobutanoate/2-iminopropanoate deaminase
LQKRNSTRKIIVNPKGSPPPAGPYSRAVRFENLVFVSGISPKNPDGSSFHGSMEDEVENVLNNIKRILEESGSKLENVLKMTVILKDSKDWANMNSVYKKYFSVEPPARTTFQSDIDAKVEMDATAYV